MVSTLIEAEFTVTTPMFLAGADQKKAELRIPSLKGALRFWWRALAWERMDGDLGKIRRAEERLFGSSETGQSRILITLKSNAQPRTIQPPNILQDGGRVVGEGVRYLGYGVLEAFGSKNKGTKAGQLIRACLQSPFNFSVHFRLKQLAEDELELLLDAIRALGLFGGLGARSRRGFGSVVLNKLEVDGKSFWSRPETLEKLTTGIAGLIPRGSPRALPRYTAFSGKPRVVLLAGSGTELDTLDLAGKEFLRYRGWGFKGKILGSDSEKNFKDDHDLMKKPKYLRDGHPRRLVFGLPHNYGKKSDLQVGPADRNLDRRASPLFFHIHQCGDTPITVISFLPAVFLPEGKRTISVGGEEIPLRNDEKLYEPIDRFLDRLMDPGQRKEPFGETREVRS